MAVTYERVTLSLVNYNMFKYAYSDGLYPRYPAIVSLSSNPASDLGDAIKSDLFKTMLANGVDNMNLYDTTNNVIGSIAISQYISQYVTFEQLSGSSDEQTSTSAYPDYRNTGTATYGIKYRRFVVDPNYAHTNGIKVVITLNGNTITRYLGSSIGAYQISDQYGTATAANVDSVLFGSGNMPKTLGLMSRTTGGVEHKYLDVVSLGAVSDEYAWGIYSVEHEVSLLADNLNITDYIVQEDGYVNELMNRFSPRYYSNMTGIYVIPESTMNDLSEGLVQQNLADWLNRAFFGSDGKQYIMAFRWYYGLLDSIQKTADLHNINFGVGKVTLGALGETPVQAKVATREFAVWQTSEMSVMPHFDNYLDMLSTYELYLPYYGFLNIDPNDIVGGTIQVFYNINLVTGTANINVVCKTARTGNLKTKSYTLNAQVGIEIPFGADMLKEMTTAWAQTCGKAFATGASMGLGMSGQGFGDIVGQAEGAMNAIASNPDITEDERAMALNNAKSVQDSARNAQSVVNVAQHAMNTMSNTTPALSPVIRSGGTSNESGSLDELFPYLLITRPMSAAPSNYEEYVGMPSYKSANLGSISGFTKVAAIKPSSMANAPKYLDEIIAQLKAGVYL